MTDGPGSPGREITAGAAIAREIGTPQKEERGGLMGRPVAARRSAFASAFGSADRCRGERLGAGGRRPTRAPLPLAAESLPIRCSSREPKRPRAPVLRHARADTGDVGGLYGGSGPERCTRSPESCTHAAATRDSRGAGHLLRRLAEEGVSHGPDPGRSH